MNLQPRLLRRTSPLVAALALTYAEHLALAQSHRATREHTPTESPVPSSEPEHFTHQGSILIGRAEAEDASESDVLRVNVAVRQQAGALASCYEGALAASPSLVGHVDVSVTVGFAGQAIGVDARGMPGTPEFIGCLVSAFRGMVFPSAAYAAVTVPITFTPSASNGPPPRVVLDRDVRMHWRGPHRTMGQILREAQLLNQL